MPPPSRKQYHLERDAPTHACVSLFDLTTESSLSRSTKSVVVLKPDRRTFERMLNWIDSGGYKPPDNVGAEQNFISEYFGLSEKLQQVDLSYNFQIHQLGLSAPGDAEEGRWTSLAKRFDEVIVHHFSAIPKPVHLLLGEINEKNLRILVAPCGKKGNGYLSERCEQVPGRTCKHFIGRNFRSSPSKIHEIFHLQHPPKREGGSVSSSRW